MRDFLFQEKERLKQEKRDEKRLNKERKLEQRRLELEMAKELKKPNEDMCLADQKVIMMREPFLLQIPFLQFSYHFPFPEAPRVSKRGQLGLDCQLSFAGPCTTADLSVLVDGPQKSQGQGREADVSLRLLFYPVAEHRKAWHLCTPIDT